MRKYLVFFVALLFSLAAKANTPSEKQEGIIYDVFIRENGVFLFDGTVYDLEGLGEFLRHVIWQKKEAEHFVRLNCTPDIQTKTKLLMLKDWVLAEYVKGKEKHPKCNSSLSGIKQFYVRPLIEGFMQKRELSSREVPFVGKWKGERKTPLGKIEYAWEVERKNDGTYKAHFFMPLAGGQKETLQKTGGFWWVKGNLYFEVQEGLVLMPDIYKFTVQDQKILYDQEYRSYQFTDYKIE